MSLKTAPQYVNSLRDLNIRAYIGGDRVENIVDHPAIAPHIGAAAKTYELAHVAEHAEMMTATSHITGEPIHRFTHIFQNADDLIKKIQMLRLVGQATGTCFQRCVGLDALNAIYAVSYEIDEAKGTRYHDRFRTYLETIQTEDLMPCGAMTDPKGNRSLRPAEQPDKDQFVHVVDRTPDGVVIRGAKLHITGAMNSHEILVMPGTALRPDEAEFAIACAVPVDTDGLTLIFGRQSNDTRKFEEGCDIGNPGFGVVGGEAMVVFDDVFVPNERIFLDGETDHCGTLVDYFATWHRANYGGCKGGNADVLIGATAKMTQILGTDRNGIVKDKLIEMIHLTETSYASAIGASAMGQPLPCGSFMVDPMMANATKQNITRSVYHVARLSHDLAGGILATLPDSAALENPEIGKYMEKYIKIDPDDDVMERVQMGRYIENATSVTTVVEAMHGAGSPQTQRIVMMGLADLNNKIELAERIVNPPSVEY